MFLSVIFRQDHGTYEAHRTYEVGLDFMRSEGDSDDDSSNDANAKSASVGVQFTAEHAGVPNSSCSFLCVASTESVTGGCSCNAAFLAAHPGTEAPRRSSQSEKKTSSVLEP
jgi:hypothetical protein